MSLPQFGLEIVSMEIPVPHIVVPQRLALSIPLFGKVELSTLMKSNLYEAQASFSAEKDVPAMPGYTAKYGMKGMSSLDVLSFEVEGIFLCFY